MIPKSIPERARAICQRLGADVTGIVPEGIGRWARAWEIVAGADAEFMLALSRWEASPRDEAAKQAVRDAYQGVLEAWRTAVTEYQRAGVGR